MSMIIKNIRIIDSKTDRITNIIIHKNSFAEIDHFDKREHFLEIIEGEKMALMPSFIDLHCHLRDPGYTYKEDLQSGQQAAIHGGFTTICCMANTSPVCDNPKIIRYVKEKAESLNLCEVIPISAVTKNLNSDQLVNFKEMIQYTHLFSNDGLPIMSENTMIEALKASSKFHFTLLTHSEPEVEMIDRDLRLLEHYGGNLHICHVSKKESVQLIRSAKQKKLNLSCEVTPHHLYASGLNYIVHPPFGDEKDRNVLLEGLLDGTIDIIATDHAPHSKKDKINGARGLIGFEHAFSLVYGIFKEKKIDLKMISQFMSEKPANLLNIPPVRFNQKSNADFVMIDLEKMYEINEKSILSKSKNTPFIGKKVPGQIIMTIRKGEIKYDHR